MKIQVVIDGQTYTVDIEDIHARPVNATVQDEKFEVWPESEDISETPGTAVPVYSVPEADLSASPMAAPAKPSGGRDVLSPLPGVIVAILAKPGEAVTHGQELCTLEAMKMKNAICANRDGTIAAVEVSVGDQVGHGQVLMTYAE